MESIKKILIVSDLHGQKFTLELVKKYLEKNKIDAVFCCGDLCNRYDPKAFKFAKEFVELIKNIYNLPLLVVHGNQEPEDVLKLFNQENISVHLKEKKLFEYNVVGVGFGEELPNDKKYFQGKIVLTHEPPRKKIIDKMIKEKTIIDAPILHFAGHLHKYTKIYKIGFKTQIIFVPTLQNHRAVLLTLPEKKINFIRL
ncbi:hypothetical protein COT76_01290 [Candidatus Berkelbacteria bacterium CG10_big_fil_rev_8_21_14_0_10_33_10]|nr:MAG: hypothetical protein COT76_01290 [Candidatus Berkelbacteria bacterium CG10_big_fil_rev_8_21_14_0_10_33_10]